MSEDMRSKWVEEKERKGTAGGFDEFDATLFQRPRQ